MGALRPCGRFDHGTNLDSSSHRRTRLSGDVALGLIGVESLDNDEPLMDAGLVPLTPEESGKSSQVVSLFLKGEMPTRP